MYIKRLIHGKFYIAKNSIEILIWNLSIVGAEAVVENGGIINRIGTYTVALCAKQLKKPFYVFSESHKFSRMYPLS